MADRLQITMSQTNAAVTELRGKLHERLKEKGYGSFASSHEILGILQEEFDEFKEAVHTNSALDLRSELYDIAVGAVFGITCIDAGGLDLL